MPSRPSTPSDQSDLELAQEAAEIQASLANYQRPAFGNSKDQSLALQQFMDSLIVRVACNPHVLLYQIANKNDFWGKASPISLFNVIQKWLHETKAGLPESFGSELLLLMCFIPAGHKQKYTDVSMLVSFDVVHTPEASSDLVDVLEKILPETNGILASLSKQLIDDHYKGILERGPVHEMKHSSQRRAYMAQFINQLRVRGIVTVSTMAQWSSTQYNTHGGPCGYTNHSDPALAFFRRQNDIPGYEALNISTCELLLRNLTAAFTEEDVLARVQKAQGYIWEFEKNNPGDAVELAQQTVIAIEVYLNASGSEVPVSVAYDLTLFQLRQAIYSGDQAFILQSVSRACAMLTKDELDKSSLFILFKDALQAIRVDGIEKGGIIALLLPTAQRLFKLSPAQTSALAHELAASSDTDPARILFDLLCRSATPAHGGTSPRLGDRAEPIVAGAGAAAEPPGNQVTPPVSPRDSDPKRPRLARASTPAP